MRVRSKLGKPSRYPPPRYGTDQIAPYADAGPLTVKLLRNGALKTYEDLPHGLCSTHPEIVNPEILAYIRQGDVKADRQAAEASPVMA